MLAHNNNSIDDNTLFFHQLDVFDVGKMHIVVQPARNMMDRPKGLVKNKIKELLLEQIFRYNFLLL